MAYFATALKVYEFTRLSQETLGRKVSNTLFHGDVALTEIRVGETLPDTVPQQPHLSYAEKRTLENCLQNFVANICWQNQNF